MNQLQRLKTFFFQTSKLLRLFPIKIAMNEVSKNQYQSIIGAGEHSTRCKREKSHLPSEAQENTQPVVDKGVRQPRVTVSISQKHQPFTSPNETRV